jgi:hypothetical protein
MMSSLLSFDWYHNGFPISARLSHFHEEEGSLSTLRDETAGESISNAFKSTGTSMDTHEEEETTNEHKFRKFSVIRGVMGVKVKSGFRKALSLVRLRLTMSLQLMDTRKSILIGSAVSQRIMAGICCHESRVPIDKHYILNIHLFLHIL